MKRMIFIFINWLCVFSIFGQTNYYTGTNVFSENEYNYQVEVVGITAQLYNMDNRWIGGYPVYKADGSAFIQPEYGYIELYDDDSWLESKRKMITITNSALTFAEKEMVKGNKFYIELYINSTTGKVDDVMFSFSNHTPWANIPVSTYREIELDIKDQLFYNLTDNGKKLNYIYTWNCIEF